MKTKNVKVSEIMNHPNVSLSAKDYIKDEKPKPVKVKTIDVIAKEWFDRINGNSYFSMQVTINYQMKNEINLSVPMQGGYGEHYRDQAFQELIRRGYLLNVPERTTYWRYYQEYNIIARHTKHENCKKKELFKG